MVWEEKKGCTAREKLRNKNIFLEADGKGLNYVSDGKCYLQISTFIHNVFLLGVVIRISFILSFCFLSKLS